MEGDLLRALLSGMTETEVHRLAEMVAPELPAAGTIEQDALAATA